MRVKKETSVLKVLGYKIEAGMKTGPDTELIEVKLSLDDFILLHN